VVAAHLSPDAPPGYHRRLEHQNIEFIELASAGGSGLRAKIGVVLAALRWILQLVPLMRRCSAVHLRTPCNVTLLGIPLARLFCRGRYAIYADNWELQGVEPASFRAQRWMLQRWGGVVHAYVPPGADLPSHIRANVSPSFTSEELDTLGPAAEERIERFGSAPMSARELRVCTLATFSERKNQITTIRAVAQLRDRGVDVRLRLAGSGRTEAAARALVEELGLGDRVEFVGRLGREAVEDLFRWADVNVLVSRAEGFGKVFLEGMAFGCPAICGPGQMQGFIVGDGARGRQADPTDPADVARLLLELRDLPTDEQAEMVRSCREFVRNYTTDAFAEEIETVVGLLLAATGGRSGRH
jgi:glycosyltransferase involved in cell wall biosynthesis